MITHKQLTLAEVFEDCQNKFDNDKYQFLSLLDEAIILDEIVPVSFVSHFLFSFPINLCLLSLCVSIVGFAWDSLNAKNAIGTLCW